MPSSSSTTIPDAVRTHLRRAFVLALLAVALTGIAPLTGSSTAEATPTANKVVFSGWNVGARPRICAVDTVATASVCSNLPITDGSPDGTSGVATADLNHDTRTDVVVTNENGTINVCLDNGSNGWTCSSQGASGRHNGVVIADLNGDGHSDIVSVIETLAQMDQCLGNGSGGFTCSRIAAPALATRLVAADFDSDGDRDLVFASPPSGGFLCLNSGAAAYTCSAIASVTTAHDVESADFNADGKLDVAFATWTADDPVCLGDGLGGFSCSVYDVGGDSSGIAVGDIDADGDVDIVEPRYNQTSRSCLNSGSGTFVCHDISIAATTKDVAIAELTGDAHLDIAVAVQGVNQICAGDGAGNFSCSQIDTASSWHSMGVGIIASPPPDADGDGVTDASDNCPSVSNAGQLDTDGDLAGDACDTDDDGDGLTDAEETGTHGTNPLVTDTDGDGWDDFVEVNDGGNPLIWPQGQSVSIAAPNPWQGANGPFPVFADATSMEPVVVTASGPCDVSGAMVVPVAPGTCTLTAAQAGGYLWSPASNSVDIELVQSVQTLTISAPVTMTVDDTIAVSATSDSGLGVTLQASGLCGLVGGDLTVTGAGTCTLTASQPGDTWREPATSTLEVDVVREPQGITIAAPSTMTAGHAAPVTVTTDSALPLSSLVVTGPCALEAGDLLALGAGTCEITAEHAGDDHWEPALATHVVDVFHEAQSIALVAPSAMLATDSVMLEAVADSGLPVAYSVTGPCSLQGDELFTDGAGTCTVTAAQTGDERWAPATATADIDVAFHPQSIVFGTPIELTVGDSLIVAAWADNGQALTFSVSGPCSIVGDVVTAAGAGTCAVTAEQSGDAAWEPATATHLISMSRRAQSITLHVPPSMTSGETATVSATSTSGLPVAVRGAGTCTVIGTSITGNDAGTCAVSADQPGDVLWAPAPTATATIAIAPAPTTSTTSTTTTLAPDTVLPETAVTRSTTAPRASTTATSSSTTTTTLDDDTTTMSRPTTSTTSTSTSTTTTTVPPGAAVRVTVTVEDLVADGLPDASEAALRLVLAGLPAGTRASIEVGGRSFEARQVGDELVFELPAGLDLSDATLEITHPDGTITRVTTADTFRDGDLAMDVEFDAPEGADAGSSTIRVFGAGFVPGSPVEVTLHSDPVKLTTVTAGANGGFDQQVELPASVEAGEHRVLLTGVSTEGPITGAWHFAVDGDGTVDRVGDPPVEAAVAGAGLEAGAIDQAAASGTGTVESPAALAAVAADVASEPAPETDAAGSDADAPVVIDEATGLAEYTPVAEPEQAVETAVESFALISIVGAGSSLLAAGVAAMPMGGVPAGGTTPGGTGGGRSGGSGGSGGSDGDKKRGKGKLAGGKAAKLGQGVEGAAWGDRSPTWRFPLTERVDAIGVAVPARLHPVSPLAARVLADGSTIRAALGSGSLIAPVMGAVLGAMAAIQTGGHAIAPPLGLMIGIVLLGVLDAFSGFLAATVFGVAVAAAGGIHSADSLRAVLGVGSIWFAAPLLAGGARAFRRRPSENAGQRWQAIGDVVLGSLLAAWAMQSAVGALPALSGLDMPVAARADFVAGVLLIALAARYGIERGAIRLYPERLARVTFDPPGKPSNRQQVLSTLFKAGMFVFVILPYIGPRWQLWAVTAMTIGPSLLGLVKDRFPNSVTLHRVLPRGVPNTLVMMTVGTVIGAAVADRITDPARLLTTSFLVLSLPGFALSLVGVFGREGASPTETWGSRVMGAAVALVAILKVRGHLGDSPWLPVALMAPAAVWWFVATRPRPEPAATDSLLDPVLDAAAGRVDEEEWPEWPADAPNDSPDERPAVCRVDPAGIAQTSR